MRYFGRLDNKGASAAEFAMVLPLLLLFIFGMIDAGRFMWEFNRAEKATQMGVRYAAVADLVPSGLASRNFALQDSIAGGDPVPTSAFNSSTCNTTSCTCTGGGVCGSIGYDATAFDNIVGRMDAMYPPINDTHVTIEYQNVGLGYAGDPNGPDVAPLITVRLTGLTFKPVTGLLFGLSFPMPSFSAALTGEDLDCDSPCISN